MTKIYLAIIFINNSSPALSAGANPLEGASGVTILSCIPSVLLTRCEAQIAAPVVEPVAIDVINDHSLPAAHNHGVETNRVLRSAVPILNQWTEITAAECKPYASLKLVKVFAIHKDNALGSLDFDYAIVAKGNPNPHVQDTAFGCQGSMASSVAICSSVSPERLS